MCAIEAVFRQIHMYACLEDELLDDQAYKVQCFLVRRELRMQDVGSCNSTMLYYLSLSITFCSSMSLLSSDLLACDNTSCFSCSLFVYTCHINVTVQHVTNQVTARVAFCYDTVRASYRIMKYNALHVSFNYR
jgi:hypothetical protein